MKIAMIFAAGKGTRLRPITDNIPKALVEIGGKTLLDYQIENLYRWGFRTIIVNVHHFADMMIDYLNKVSLPGLDIIISNEKEHLLNTGGGLKQAGKLLKKHQCPEHLLIHNVDIFDNADLNTLYQSCNNVDACLQVSERQTQRYLLFDGEYRLVGWENVATGEIKTPYPNLNTAHCRRLAFAGMHVVKETVFDEMEQWPEEFSVIDFYVQSCRKLHIKGVFQPNLKIFDVGKIETLPMAEDFLKELKGNS